VGAARVVPGMTTANVPPASSLSGAAPVLDVDESSFPTEVLERSHSVPVVVDYWAAWCGPCRVLGPVLERLAQEAGGSWTLAKVDVDANPRLAAAAGVQGIPAVRAFRDGRQVAEFTGALPEPQVREWLRALGPSEADTAVAEAKRKLDAGDVSGAADAFREALESDPGHPGARGGLRRAELQARASQVDEAELVRRLEADPGDARAGLQAADLAAARGDLEGAFNRLVALVAATSGIEREEARRHLLGLLETVPPADPRAVAARRALSRALF
jgi:putative thioredoxin